MRPGTVIVTGGAGFIGSCMVRTLNDMSVEDIVIVDNIASTEKWKNLNNKAYREYAQKETFMERLFGGAWERVSAVIHLGACSSTTQTDFDYLWRNNVDFSKALWRYCTERQIPLIYASSAATYGDGAKGFDDRTPIAALRPLNAYGYSKQAFDLWATRQTAAPPQHVGLKFFNVYGPNEYCKGAMASMAYHGYRQIRERGRIRLFKSCSPDYADGGQLRDFVYVKDVCAVMAYFLEHPERSGLFNVGTGRAQTFAELAGAVFAALGLPPKIEYIDMPEPLREKYQYYTRAETGALREAGYAEPFADVTRGVADYVRNYLANNFAIY